MFIHTRQWTPLFAILVVVAASAVCGGPTTKTISDTSSKSTADPSTEANSVTETPRSETATASVVDAGSPGGPRYTFRLNPTTDRTLYCVIENEFRDSGGVPPLLAYSTWAKDRKTIKQQVIRSSDRPVTVTTQPRGVYVTWRCDRHEVQEQGHKDKITYDSIRDSYPPPSLMDLGGVVGSMVNFVLDPETGKADQVGVTLKTLSAGTSRRNLSRTADKCQWDQKSVSKLLNDLGPFYFPKGPVRIGDTWTRTDTEVMKTFGTVTTKARCTLRSVRKKEGRDVATVDIASEITLAPESKPPAASRPTTASAPAANKPKDFRIDHAACSGSVEFDLTRGELVQLTLRRDLAFVADVSSPNSGPMQLKSGSEHILRVRTSQSAPPQPIIVGGPKPPVVPPEEAENPGRNRGRMPPRRGPGATTRPVLPRSIQTTRPSVPQAHPTTTMPVNRHPPRPAIGNTHRPTTAPVRGVPRPGSRPAGAP